MGSDALDTYLNDHLAGSTVGVELAHQIRERSQGSPLAEVMEALTRQIEEDRETLIGLMESIGTAKSPVKQAAGWVTEKASRVKFSGLMSGTSEQGMLMALESLALGVEGKRALWTMLKEVRTVHPPLTSIDLDALVDRATEQRAALEAERLAVGRRVLGAPST
jgi:hypothetical protein